MTHFFSTINESVQNIFQAIIHRKADNYDLTNMILKASKTNTIFSKFSAQQALLYIRNGISDPSIIEQYDNLLDNKDIDYYKNLNEYLAGSQYNTFTDVDSDQKISETVRTKVISANSFWIIKDIVLNEDYEKLMSGIGIIFVAKNDKFVQQKIDTWIQMNTQNMIKNMQISDDAAVIALNAIYFKAKWVDPFNANNTLDKLFFISSKKK